MSLSSDLRRMACVALGASSLFGCDRPEREAYQEPVAAAVPVEQAVSSTLMVFDLSPAEMDALAKQALQGDAEAAFRIAQFYSLAGGEGDPNINDEHDRQQEVRWLELAAKEGHLAAEFNLAVALAPDDCPRARSIMTGIRDRSADGGDRDRAASWLRDPRFAC